LKNSHSNAYSVPFSYYESKAKTVNEEATMRGAENCQEAMFSYVSPEARVPQKHPLRPIRKMVDKALAELSQKFTELYSHAGRPSVAPEYLLKGSLLQDPLLCAKRALTDGAAQLQPPIPIVRWPIDG
jgi:hypothetical protein